MSVVLERCCGCGEVHERDNCPEALARALAQEAELEREPVWDYEGAILASQEDWYL